MQMTEEQQTGSKPGRQTMKQECESLEFQPEDSECQFYNTRVSGLERGAMLQSTCSHR